MANNVASTETAKLALPDGMMLPLHVGPDYIAGVPIYFSDDRHFCTVFSGGSPDYDARGIAKAIVDAVNAAYNKGPKQRHAQG